MLRILVIVLPLIFQIYCLVDCAQTPAEQLRNLPKWAWIAIIIIFSLIGSIGYIIAGRAPRGGFGSGPKRRVLPPDDDPDFLKNL